MLLAPPSVNHKLPSGPATMSRGTLSVLGVRNWIITPAAVIVPISLVPLSVNHRLPSEPSAIPPGLLFAGRSYSAITFGDREGEVVLCDIGGEADEPHPTVVVNTITMSQP